MENLKDSFIKALQATSGVTDNSYLVFLRDAVEKVSDASQLDSILAEYNQKLLKISSENNFSLDPDKTNEFAQLLGEAQFYLFCKNRGVNLERIKECNNKTPDFKHVNQDIFFEVKTLSVVSGGSGINNALEDALDAQIDIEKQLQSGKRVATGISVVQPYGEKPYQKGKGTVTAVIETLIEKTKQNLKKEQFSNGVSFLVLNLSIIPPFRTENFILRPAYCDDYMFKKCISGELWMVAFARPGMPVLGMPEFEGKPCVESIIDRYGILVDQEYDFVDGILFMIHPWQRNAEIWGLFSYDKYVSWKDNEPDIVNTLNSIVGNNWNDDKDTNGCILNG